jgi:Methyltransferase domain
MEMVMPADQIALERLTHEFSKIKPTLAGWCSVDKAYKLIETILADHPLLCVEIGVFGGASLIPQAMALKHNNLGKVVGIDPWQNEAMIDGMAAKNHIDWWKALDLTDIKKQCIAAVNLAQVHDYVEIVEAKAEDVVDRFQEISLLHVDGNHSEDNVYNYVAMYLPRVAIGGIIAINDIFWAEENQHVTTRKAVMYALEFCERVCMVSDCIFMRKIK